MNANDNDNNPVNASRSCSRCGSINSTKSAIVVPSNQLTNEEEFESATKVSTPSLRYKRCTSNLSDEEDRPHFCNSRETLSRRSSVSHLTHDAMSSFGSYTSLSFRSTGNGEGVHRSNRHSPHKHSHSHYHHRHHNHNHHYHGQNSTRKHQVYYQTHHALCKRAFSGESHGGKLHKN
ncbi:homeobox protein MOX-2-like [Contarinia nasturtii]|uniref:homeobox protein MOX-2-like n=1 Tax=Contarinia nasturtii TaxID=265458 RepID=UPI0012D3A1A6|nr:homeobox protein MOX-2-like [Contarinia nasturtii]